MEFKTAIGYRFMIMKKDKFDLLFTKERFYPAPDCEIQHAIDALKDEFRIPFRLFLEGYKFNDIANQLDLSYETVKSRIFFARICIVRWLTS